MASVVSLAEALASSSSTGKTTTKSISDLNADDFLSLMITQLKNQDPTKPTSTSEMLTQMTQMSTITTFDDLNKSFTSLLNMDWIGLSTSMLGKQVTYKNADDESVTGIVDSVEYVDSNVYLVVGEDKIEMTDIIGVDEASSTAETDSTTETGTESS